MNNSNVSRRTKLPLALSVGALVAMAAVLNGQGRIWWCKLNDYGVYVNDAWGSSHTSQHLFDPYTFTHVLHGVLIFWIASVIFSSLPVSWRFFISIVVEAGWEILENSSFIIEKYRENTASQDYFGDSIMNSIGDVIACAFGFYIAMKLGWWRSLVFFLLVEVILLLWIRDSFILNIVMLIYPLAAIKRWQMGIL